MKPRQKDTPAPELDGAACQMAEDLGAAAIVAGTSSGSTARLVARFRPACPVVGLTPKVLTQRQLTLSWGVIPTLVAPFADTEEDVRPSQIMGLRQGSCSTRGLCNRYCRSSCGRSRNHQSCESDRDQIMGSQKEPILRHRVD